MTAALPQVPQHASYHHMHSDTTIDPVQNSKFVQHQWHIQGPHCCMNLRCPWMMSKPKWGFEVLH